MTPRQQRNLDQLNKWVEGRSVHNVIDNECCLDFSCCVPELFIQDRGERMDKAQWYRKRIGLAPKFDA